VWGEEGYQCAGVLAGTHECLVHQAIRLESRW